jgi:hypothetical protein
MPIQRRFELREPAKPRQMIPPSDRKFSNGQLPPGSIPDRSLAAITLAGQGE